MAGGISQPCLTLVPETIFCYLIFDHIFLLALVVETISHSLIVDTKCDSKVIVETKAQFVGLTPEALLAMEWGNYFLTKRGGTYRLGDSELSNFSTIV